MLTTISPIHSPSESPPKIDFWQWRQNRRQVIDLVLALANSDIIAESDKGRLRTWAERLEMETLLPDELAALKSFVYPTNPNRLQTNTDLAGALLDRLPPGAPIGEHAEYWLQIEPNWDIIDSVLKPVFFSGRVGCTNLHAALTPTFDLVPSYEVTWLDKPNSPIASSDTLPLLNAMIGQNLDEGALTWDWLFTKRLTWLSEQGFLKWPEHYDILALDVQSFSRPAQPV